MMDCDPGEGTSDGRMMRRHQMECQLIDGIRENSKLLHVPSENMLYVYKCVRNERKEYICYQTILSAPKRGSAEGFHPKCNARVRLLANGTCERMNVQHTLHNNHAEIVSDLAKRNEMKRKCKTLRDEFTEDAHRIPTKHIFQREIVK